MPTYFFDVTDAGVIQRDDFGTDCRSDDEARDLAVSLSSDIAQEKMPDGDQHEIVVVARNDDGKVVYEANLSLNGRWWPGRR